MADTLCGYPDREDALVSYLYDGMDTAARTTFDAHLAICAKCRQEIGALGDVRAHLAGWRAPETAGIDVNPFAVPFNQPPAKITWRTLPVWVQAAAALLVLGVSAGVANLDVHYDAHGLVVRTGWMKPAAASAQVTAEAGTAPWRTDLTALERQLRSEFRTATAAMPTPAASSESTRLVSNDADVLRKVRALLDASEKRQQNELALRATEIVNNFRAQRNSDLSRIDNVLVGFQTRTDSRLAQQKASINYLVSAQQKQ